MRKKLKPFIAASIVLIGAVFVKLGNITDIWMFIISMLGTVVVLIPAYFWYNDKLNM